MKFNLIKITMFLLVIGLGQEVLGATSSDVAAALGKYCIQSEITCVAGFEAYYSSTFGCVCEVPSQYSSYDIAWNSEVRGCMVDCPAGTFINFSQASNVCPSGMEARQIPTQEYTGFPASCY